MKQCPQCGAYRERIHAKTRPRLRLRRILGAGLTGAFIFAFLGYWSHKALSWLSPDKVNDPTSSSPSQNGNIIVLTLKGVMLLVGDLIAAIGRLTQQNPTVLVLAFIGFLLAAALVARRQQLTWRGLKRHLRHKWEQLTLR